jgi:hypothetical protein
MQAKDFANTCGSVVISFREMTPRFCSPQTYLRRGTRDLSFSVIAKSYGRVVDGKRVQRVRCWHENEEFFDIGGDLVVDLRFERVCAVSADVSREASPARRHHNYNQRPRSVVPTAAARPFRVRRASCRSLSPPALSKEVVLTLSCVRSANPTNAQWRLSPARGYWWIMQAPTPVETHGALLGAAGVEKKQS